MAKSTYADQSNCYQSIPEATPCGALDNHNASLNESLNMLHDTIARTRSLGVRLMGERPEQVGKNGSPSPSDPPLLRKLEDTAGYIRECAAELSSLVSRLEEL